jgi:hypothetical protein
VAEGDLVDLLLHRAGIGIDEDAGGGHLGFPLERDGLRLNLIFRSF